MADDTLQARPLASYPGRHVVATRWSDNDMYGHINNAVYYEYFDAAINTWISSHLTVGFESVPVIGIVAESGCRFHNSLSFPGLLTVGIRITRLGRSSVTYDLGVFDSHATEDTVAAATGHWVHVYVDRETGEVVPVPDVLRTAMDQLITKDN